MSSLSDQDREDLETAMRMATEALALVRAVEKRHQMDISGAALTALSRAETDLEMAPIDIRSSAQWLGGGLAA